MAVENLGKQAFGIFVNPGTIASAIAGGSIGIAGGAMIKGQQSEEAGNPLSQQALSTLGGGLVGGLGGAGIAYGGAVALSAAKHLIRKK